MREIDNYIDDLEKTAKQLDLMQSAERDPLLVLSYQRSAMSALRLAEYLKELRELRKKTEPKKGKWNPTCERAPERNGWFITTCEDICGRAVHTVFYDAKYKKWGRGGVVAWQPMPEPYKEGEA